MDRTSLRVAVERWPRARPFRITGHVSEAVDVVVVELGLREMIGRGEAAGVRYRNEDVASIVRQIESVREQIESGLSRQELQQTLPPGGARNALDCAMWDLEAKLSGRPVWQLAGLAEPRPLLTTFTCGADEPRQMVDRAMSFEQARAIKLKLTGEAVDADRVRAVRDARPEVWLCVDANQGFTPRTLERIMPVLVENDVKLIEQPFPRGQDQLLTGFRSPLPIAADESVQSTEDLADLAGRFNVVNVKLDKCGGLTEGLRMARAIRALGMDVMVGCMGGTSLAMAPGFLVGQLCDVVDLDAPAQLKLDRAHPVDYSEGRIRCPPALWGH